MKNSIERIRLREENTKVNTEMLQEISDINRENTAGVQNESIWTIDTSSFLTLICC